MAQGAFKAMKKKLLKKKEAPKSHKSKIKLLYIIDKKIAPKKLTLIKQNTINKKFQANKIKQIEASLAIKASNTENLSILKEVVEKNQKK